MKEDEILSSQCPFCFGNNIVSFDSITWICFECKYLIKHGKILKENIDCDKELKKIKLKLNKS